jgi:hypothetical protein
MRLKSGQLKKLTSGKKQLRNPSMTLYYTENVSRINIKCDEEVLVKDYEADMELSVYRLGKLRELWIS